LNAALDGSLNDAEYRKDPNFGFEFPIAVTGVDSKILNPREAWSNKAEYDKTAQALVQQFIDNFTQFESHVDKGVRSAAPIAA
jgi:phosphoenolpyruvate carboxykinase (ATP)